MRHGLRGENLLIVTPKIRNEVEILMKMLDYTRLINYKLTMKRGNLCLV